MGTVRRVLLPPVLSAVPLLSLVSLVSSYSQAHSRHLLQSHMQDRRACIRQHKDVVVDEVARDDQVEQLLGVAGVSWPAQSLDTCFDSVVEDVHRQS